MLFKVQHKCKYNTSEYAITSNAGLSPYDAYVLLLDQDV